MRWGLGAQGRQFALRFGMLGHELERLFELFPRAQLEPAFLVEPAEADPVPCVPGVEFGGLVEVLFGLMLPARSNSVRRKSDSNSQVLSLRTRFEHLEVEYRFPIIESSVQGYG